MQPAVERSKFLKGQKNCQFLLQLFLNALFFSFSAHGAFGLTYISNTPRVLQGRKKIQFCNRNCGISYIFMNPSYFRFSFPLLLFFFF